MTTLRTVLPILLLTFFCAGATECDAPHPSDRCLALSDEARATLRACDLTCIPEAENPNASEFFWARWCSDAIVNGAWCEPTGAGGEIVCRSENTCYGVSMAAMLQCQTYYDQ